MTIMSQLTTGAAGMAGTPSANMACGFCQKPVIGVFYRVMGRFACTNCAGQVQAAIDHQSFNPTSFAKAAGAGLAAGIGGAVAWAAIVQLTHFEIGIVASFIGVGVGKAVAYASGKRRGPAYQKLAMGLALLGVAGGKLLIDAWQTQEYLKTEGQSISAGDLARLIWQFLLHKPSALFSVIDLLWIGIAVFAAWQICRVPAITMAGPFPVPAAAPDLQFQTVEPAVPAAEPAPGSEAS
jgi:hypothetical protein